jgi:hypothetical protein
MQITVKVKPREGKKASSVVQKQLKKLTPAAKVEEVFPGVQSGRRAGMVIVNLPDDLSDTDSQAVLRSLREAEDIEYAEPAAPRKGLRGKGRGLRG